MYLFITILGILVESVQLSEQQVNTGLYNSQEPFLSQNLSFSVLGCRLNYEKDRLKNPSFSLEWQSPPQKYETIWLDFFPCTSHADFL